MRGYVTQRITKIRYDINKAGAEPFAVIDLTDLGPSGLEFTADDPAELRELAAILNVAADDLEAALAAAKETPG
jgi:hypothetical protein